MATYATLTYTPEMPSFVNPFMILLGTLLYSTMTLLFHIIFPHRPVQDAWPMLMLRWASISMLIEYFRSPDGTELSESHQSGWR